MSTETPRPDDAITIEQACKLVKVSRRTMYNWMGTNKVLFVRSAAGSPRILASSLFRRGNVEPRILARPVSD